MLGKGDTITVCHGDQTTIYEVVRPLPDKKKTSRLYKLEVTEVDSTKPPYTTVAWLPNSLVRSDKHEVHSDSNMRVR